MKDKVLSFPVRRNDDRFAYDTRGQVTAAVLRATTPHAVPAGYTYDAFGQTVSSAGPMREVFPHRFSTKWHDDYLGMVDYGRRWYHPRMGRWINRDPIGEEGGENLYRFCGNSLLSQVDSFGLSFWNCCNECSLTDEPIVTGIAWVLQNASYGLSPGTKQVAYSLFDDVNVLGMLFSATDIVGSTVKEVGVKVGTLLSLFNSGIDVSVSSSLQSAVSLSLKNLNETMGRNGNVAIWICLSLKKCRNKPCLWSRNYNVLSEEDKWIKSPEQGINSWEGGGFPRDDNVAIQEAILPSIRFALETALL